MLGVKFQSLWKWIIDLGTGSQYFDSLDKRYLDVLGLLGVITTHDPVSVQYFQHSELFQTGTDMETYIQLSMWYLVYTAQKQLAEDKGQWALRHGVQSEFDGKVFFTSRAKLSRLNQLKLSLHLEKFRKVQTFFPADSWKVFFP